MSSIGSIIAFILTVMVFSYLGSEIPMLRYIFRITQHIFVGAALGYATVVVLDQVILRKIEHTVQGGDPTGFIPLIMGVVLLMRPWARNIGNLPLAFIVGVGSALALTGALFGTLEAQIIDTIGRGAQLKGGNLFDIIGNIVLILGVIFTLCYFFFSFGHKGEGNPQGPFRIFSRLGRYTMMVAFGGLLATLTALSVEVLRERIYFLLSLGGFSGFH